MIEGITVWSSTPNTLWTPLDKELGALSVNNIIYMYNNCLTQLKGHVFFWEDTLNHPSSFDPCSLTKQVTVHQGHQVPQYPKQEPGPGKRGGEQEELVAPLHVQKRCP